MLVWKYSKAVKTLGEFGTLTHFLDLFVTLQFTVIRTAFIVNQVKPLKYEPFFSQ
jgi:hypothetical protein